MVVVVAVAVVGGGAGEGAGESRDAERFLRGCCRDTAEHSRRCFCAYPPSIYSTQTHINTAIFLNAAQNNPPCVI